MAGVVFDWLIGNWSVVSCRRLPTQGSKGCGAEERDVPANGCCQEKRRRVIDSGAGPGTGGRAARCAAARKDLDNNHAAAAARAWRAMVGGGVRIGCVVHCRRFDLRHWSSHQLPGVRNVGLAAGACQQPVVADAMSGRNNIKSRPCISAARATHYLPQPLSAARQKSPCKRRQADLPSAW